MQPRVPGDGIVRSRRPAPRNGRVGGRLPAEALAPIGGAVRANRIVPAGGAGGDLGARPRVGTFRGGGAVLGGCPFRASPEGGTQGLGDAAPRDRAGARQVCPVSRPRKSLRGGFCEDERTPSERSPGVPIPGPLGGSRGRSSQPWRLGPHAPGSRSCHLKGTGVPRPIPVPPQRSGSLNL